MGCGVTLIRFHHVPKLRGAMDGQYSHTLLSCSWQQVGTGDCAVHNGLSKGLETNPAHSKPQALCICHRHFRRIIHCSTLSRHHGKEHQGYPPPKKKSDCFCYRPLILQEFSSLFVDKGECCRASFLDRSALVSAFSPIQVHLLSDQQQVTFSDLEGNNGVDFTAELLYNTRFTFLLLERSFKHGWMKE